jgi:hypothetical protein
MEIHRMPFLRWTARACPHRLSVALTFATIVTLYVVISAQTPAPAAGTSGLRRPVPSKVRGSVLSSRSTPPTNRAFRTAVTGMRDLKQELLNVSATAVQNWTLETAVGVFDDGTVIAGYGFNSIGQHQPFLAVLPTGAGPVHRCRC